MKPLLGCRDGDVEQVGYTINLNLPETADPEVFSAIFKAQGEPVEKIMRLEEAPRV